MTPSSKRLVTTPFQGVDPGSNPGGATIWPCRLKARIAVPQAVDEMAEFSRVTSFDYSQTDKVERRLTTWIDE